MTSVLFCVKAGKSDACQYAIYDSRETKSGITPPKRKIQPLKFLLGIFHNTTNQVGIKISVLKKKNVIQCPFSHDAANIWNFIVYKTFQNCRTRVFVLCHLHLCKLEQTYSASLWSVLHPCFVVLGLFLQVVYSFVHFLASTRKTALYPRESRRSVPSVDVLSFLSPK